MNMNMFEEFAKINISGKNNGNIKVKNEVKNEQKNIKKVKKIIHGKNVILKRGQFKGYIGFVCDHNMETCDVEVEEYTYVMSSMYNNCVVGDSIMTRMGHSVIMNKIDMMYSLKLKK